MTPTDSAVSANDVSYTAGVDITDFSGVGAMDVEARASAG